MPGFSWHNKRPAWPFDEIPREEGESTAIFKCNSDPPVGASKFLAMKSVPSDHCLWLVGLAGKLLRGELKTAEFPRNSRAEK